MNETTWIALRIRKRSWIAVASAAGFFVMAGILLCGCAEPAKPDPAQASEKPVAPDAAFNEICNRSLNDDLAFVKSRLSPELLAQLGGAASDQAVRGLMDELRTCRAVSVLETAQGGRVILQVARGQSGGVFTCRADMVPDAQGGWLLVGKLYDAQPLDQAQNPK